MSFEVLLTQMPLRNYKQVLKIFKPLCRKLKFSITKTSINVTKRPCLLSYVLKKNLKNKNI